MSSKRRASSLGPSMSAYTVDSYNLKLNLLLSGLIQKTTIDDIFSYFSPRKQFLTCHVSNGHNLECQMKCQNLFSGKISLYVVC